MTKQHFSTKKIVLIIAIFYLALTSIRLVWVHYYSDDPQQPEAEKGVLDLSEWVPTDDKTLHLNGEWEFFPDELLTPSEVKEEGVSIDVPENWQEYLPDTENNYGYGTYRLTVQLPETEQDIFGLRFREIYSAANIFVDGELVETKGEVGTDAETTEGRYGPFYTLFSPATDEVEIVIQVANYEMPIFGGITKPIKIGTDTAIIEESARSPMLQVIVAIAYFSIAIFALIIYLLGRAKYEKELLFFGFMLVMHGIAILLDDEAPLQLAIGTSDFFTLLVFFILSSLMGLILFLKELFQIESRFFQFLIGFFIAIIAYTVVFSLEMVIIIVPLIMVFYLVAIGYLYIITFKSIKKFQEETIFILLFISAYTSNMAWGVLINFGIVDIPYYPFDFLATVLAIIALLINRHIRLIKINQQQTEELKIQDEKKDIFLANTAHELRNPLHGIINIAYTFLEDPEKEVTENEERKVHLLLRIGNRMASTLDDLLDVSRLQDQQIQLEKRAISIHNTTSGTIDMVCYTKEGKDILLINEIPPDFPLIYADKDRMIQIMFNLLHNAVKYTNEGVITVTAEHNRRLAKISVQDTGIGISEENLESIFKMYEQVQSIETNRIGGLGLGLGIMKELVELHGGEVFVDSEVGVGSVFSFTVPLATEGDVSSDEEKVTTKEIEAFPSSKEVSASLEEVASPQNGSDRVKLLLIDDDPMNLEVLKTMLSSQYNVLTAPNGQKALELLIGSDVDLVITDVMMPNMSGYELTKKIRETYTISELPILLLTARTETEDIYTGFLAGANDYIVKPVNPLELKARIDAFANLQRSIQDQLRMEAAWLQAQIQPHFLFNTLNTIASLSTIDTDRMIRLLDAFGNYLRRSFDTINSLSVVPVKHELELVRSYVTIEEERFRERLEVIFDIDKTLDFDLPPLSIQPLVENAITHGVLKQKEGGTVCVTVKREMDQYIISVRDNGVGMTKERVKEILTANRKKAKGIGVGNTNHRLVQLYGDGLKIESVVGEGTEVWFSVPVE
jgi:sensor histidine kinase YesM